jgi:hypothetical protein
MVIPLNYVMGEVLTSPPDNNVVAGKISMGLN